MNTPLTQIDDWQNITYSVVKHFNSVVELKASVENVSYQDLLKESAALNLSFVLLRMPKEEATCYLHFITHGLMRNLHKIYRDKTT